MTVKSIINNENYQEEKDLKKEIILQRNNQVNDMIVKVKEQLELNEKNINLHFNDLQNELNKKKEQLLLELNKIGNEKLQNLQNENNLLNNYLCLLENNNLNELNELKVLNNLNLMNDFNIYIENDKNNLINLINTKLGIIDTIKIKKEQLLFNLKEFNIDSLKLISKFSESNFENKNFKLSVGYYL